MSACVVCAEPVPPRRRNSCSAECKRIAKRQYDAARYADVREAKIASACAWQRANRERKQAYDAAYRERTRRHRLETKRAYYQTHPLEPGIGALRQAARRARKVGNGSFIVTRRDLAHSLARFDGCCGECRGAFTSTNPLEWDHIIPIARGGRHSIGNLWPLCRDCNRGKHHRLLVEWRAGRVVAHRRAA